MKKTILIVSSILVLCFLSFRVLNKHRNKLDEEREWYLSNLHYNFSATIDSVRIQRSSHGMVYFHVTDGDFSANTELLLKQKLKLHAALFLLKEYSVGCIEIASEHADQFLEQDSVIINSDRNEIAGYRNVLKVKSNDLFTSLRGGEY